MHLRYSWREFRGDLAGGAVAALIALPYGLAMASLMRLPPVLGLFTSFLTAPITAALGRNPVLIGGTASATVPFIAMAVQQQGVGGAAKITIVAAIFMMMFGLLRLGRYIRRVPVAVVAGFSSGIGAMMIIGQMRTVLGLHIPSDPSAVPLSQLYDVLLRLDQTKLAPFVLGAAVVAIAFAASSRFPQSPAPLIGVAVACVAGQFLGLHEKEVGRLPLEIPPFAGFSWTPQDIVNLIPSALALAIVASMNILITSRVVDRFRDRRTSGPDTELGAYGIANLCAGIFGAPLSAGIPARSLANVRCGGTTRMSNVVHAVFLLLLVSLGAGAVSHIPIPALAGVTIYIGLCLLDWPAWKRLAKMRRADAAAFLLTAFGVVSLNAVAAIGLGCTVYVASWAWGASQSSREWEWTASLRGSGDA